ncbi:hypothetical protein E2320_006347 [Naja naja]|nr:hypothetical protein E2320_006347 [Naja naja]
MQVSFACSEHNVKSRTPEERLSRQNAGSPGARGRFRAVAMVAQSLGQLSTQSVKVAKVSLLLASQHQSPANKPPFSRVVCVGCFFRNLGKSGLRVSCLGLGTWVTFGGQITDEGSGPFKPHIPSDGTSNRGLLISAPGITSMSLLQVAEQLMTLAYDNGINLFDTAEVYAAGKAEVVLGNIIKKKGWRRSSLVITTKIFWGGKKHIIEGLKGSLERLQLNYVDVVFANRPDPNTPMEETVRAMTHVINQGMAMYWGTSRWSSMEIMAGAMASPLACGIVSGKYDGGIPLFRGVAKVLPKLSSSIIHEIDSILGNKPYSKKDYRS